MTSPIRVLVADDHTIVRQGLVEILKASPDVEVVGEAADGAEAVEKAAKLRPDVVVLDVSMPHLTGLEAARRIREALPATRVLVLTMHDDEEYVLKMVRAGASGYLLKDTDPVRLPQALKGVLEGEAALPRTLVAKVIDEFRERGRRKRLMFAKRRGVELTSREWEVLELLHQKLSTAEIAERLFVSQVTVRSHIAAILKKLRVESREEALRLLEERE